MKKVAIIMAGGSGAKLWPSSTDEKAKQFVDFFGNRTMLQNTYQRLSSYFNKEDIFIACYESQSHIVKEQIQNLEPENLIEEPYGRNTSACIALASVDLYHRYNNDDLIFAFPADHIIQSESQFFQSLDIASKAAIEKNSVVTIGLNPVRPSKRYGYIQVSDNLDSEDLPIKKVTAFAEKPDVETAQRFIESRDFLWNSGIFIWKQKVLFKQLDEYLPEISNQFKLLRKYWGHDNYKQNVEFTFKQIDAVSLDYGILEKADEVYCVEGKFAWSDIGTWDEMFRLTNRDENNNASSGKVVTINTQNSYIYSKDKLIAVVDLENIIAVESDDAILICKRGKSEDVKEVIDHLRRRELDKLL